jgi:hypothetical protein
MQFSWMPEEVFVDDEHTLNRFDALETNCLMFKRRNYNLEALPVEQVWEQSSTEWKTLHLRSGAQRGSLDSILHSAGPFTLAYCSQGCFEFAVQSSRNFYQYFGADSTIIPLCEYEDNGTKDTSRSNVIIFALGQGIPNAVLQDYPIRVEETRLLLTTKEQITISIPLGPAMGGVWLRPLPNERLELVVWGADLAGLRQASRLIPTLSGAGQPDFVILGTEARWTGHAGALAMGFLDYEWKISAASYLPD